MAIHLNMADVSLHVKPQLTERSQTPFRQEEESGDPMVMLVAHQMTGKPFFTRRKQQRPAYQFQIFF